MIPIIGAKVALAFIGGAVVRRMWSLSRLASFHKSNEGTKSGRQGKRERTGQEETADWSRESQSEKQRSRTNAQPSKEPSNQDHYAVLNLHPSSPTTRKEGTQSGLQGKSEVIGQEERLDDWRRESHLERIRSRLIAELSIAKVPSNQDQYAVLALDPSRLVTRKEGTKMGWQGKRELIGQGETAERSKVPSNQKHYAVLDLDPSRSHSYTDAEIKGAVRAKAFELHFDTFKTSKLAKKKFYKVMEAYDALKGSK